MWTIKKNFRYLRHILVMLKSNTARMAVSVVGLGIGLIILTMGNIILNSYYNKCFEEVNQFSEYSIELKISADESIYTEFLKLDEKVTSILVNPQKYVVFYGEYTNGFNCVLNSEIVGTSAVMDDVIPVRYGDEFIPIDGRLIEGRWINGSDVASQNKVVVIDEFTKNMVFGKEDAIGKQISIGREYIDKGAAVSETKKGEGLFENMTVIGVMNNPKTSINEENIYNKFLSAGTENLFLNTVAYVPYSLVTDMENNNRLFVWNYKTEGEYETMLSRLEAFNVNNSEKISTFEISTKDELVTSITNELKPLRMFIEVILFGLLIISGINSMNVMLILVKERMGEIGIKKALGATSGDIIIQFMFEGIMLAIISAVIAVPIACYISVKLSGFIYKLLFESFAIKITVDTILFTFQVAGLYGIIFSLIPSYYASRVKVVDALRFE